MVKEYLISLVIYVIVSYVAVILIYWGDRRHKKR